MRRCGRQDFLDDRARQLVFVPDAAHAVQLGLVSHGVFMDRALELFPADYWRYCVIADAPESDDADFTWEQFAATVNKDLANNFGNFVSRTLKLAAKHFGCEVPSGGEPGPCEDHLRSECKQTLAAYRTHLGNLEFRKAVQELRRLWPLGNACLDKRAPWSLVREDRTQAAVVLRTAVNLTRIYGIAARPLISFIAERLLDALHLSGEERHSSLARLGDDLGAPLTPGRTFEVPPILFERIDDRQVAALREKVGGDK